MQLRGQYLFGSSNWSAPKDWTEASNQHSAAREVCYLQKSALSCNPAIFTGQVAVACPCSNGLQCTVRHCPSGWPLSSLLRS